MITQTLIDKKDGVIVLTPNELSPKLFSELNTLFDGMLTQNHKKVGVQSLLFQTSIFQKDTFLFISSQSYDVKKSLEFLTTHENKKVTLICDSKDLESSRHCLKEIKITHINISNFS